MAKYCRYCGAENKEETKFCGSCGANLVDSTTTANNSNVNDDNRKSKLAAGLLGLFLGSLGEKAFSKGLVSAYPIALNNPALKWNLEIKYLTTAEALAEDNSQFEGYCALCIGSESVCPSTLIE